MWRQKGKKYIYRTPTAFAPEQSPPQQRQRELSALSAVVITGANCMDQFGVCAPIMVRSGFVPPSIPCSASAAMRRLGRPRPPRPPRPTRFSPLIPRGCRPSQGPCRTPSTSALRSAAARGSSSQRSPNLPDPPTRFRPRSRAAGRPPGSPPSRLTAFNA